MFDISDNAISARLNTRIKHNSWNFQINYNFQGARKSGQLDAKSFSVVDFGLGKDIFNDRATVTLKADNPFNSQVYRGAVNGNNYKIDYLITNVGPRVYATFTYRFNRKKTDKDRMPN